MTYSDDDYFDEDSEPPRQSDEGRSRPSRKRTGNSRTRSSGRGGPRRGGGSSGGGSAGAALNQRGVRLAILIGLVAVVLIVLVMSVRSCQRDRLVSSYKSYVNATNTLGAESQQIGQEMQVLLENQDFRAPKQVSEQITELATRATGLSTSAESLSPPDALKAANNTFITVLQYRRDALQELAVAVLGASAAASERENVRATLLEPLKALGASDVIFKRSFLGPATDAFEKDSIKDVNIQPSYIFPDGAFDDASEAGVSRILNNLKQVRAADPTTSGDSGSKHGLDIQGVFALANGGKQQLSQASLVTVPASADLTFEVYVEDGGDFIENNVDVVFVYTTPSDTTGQEQRQTIASISPGASNAEKVTFRIPTPYTRAPSTITVTAEPVPGEANRDNNTATYAVQFQVSG